MYIPPPDGYDFRQNLDYHRIIINSGSEDENLLGLIQSIHYCISYVYNSSTDPIPIIVNGNVNPTTLTLLDREFEKIEDVIDFVKEISKDNYFFLYSYHNSRLRFSILPLSQNINGLKEYKRDRLIDSIIEK